MIDPALDYPEEPPEAGEDAVSDGSVLRYDDVIQDGRLRLESAWRPTGKLLWGIPDVRRVLGSMEKGVTNVLSRTVLEGSDAELVPRSEIRTRVGYRFEHTVDARGDVARLLFSTWLVASARGKDGDEKVAGRAYGQRVFTRLDAPPGKHLVTRLDGFGPSGVPAHRGRFEPATSLLELPRGAVALDEKPRLDPGRIVFGLSHTDLNQHVNFFMYHRAVEQAALGRAVDLGRGARLAARHAAFGYKKPSFAGEVLRVALRAFALGDAFGVLALVVDADGGPDARARFEDFGAYRCAARMVFKR